MAKRAGCSKNPLFFVLKISFIQWGINETITRLSWKFEENRTSGRFYFFKQKKNIRNGIHCMQQWSASGPRGPTDTTRLTFTSTSHASENDRHGWNHAGPWNPTMASGRAYPLLSCHCLLRQGWRTNSQSLSWDNGLTGTMGLRPRVKMVFHSPNGVFQSHMTRMEVDFSSSAYSYISILNTQRTWYKTKSKS